jgi:hypothetical protein
MGAIARALNKNKETKMKDFDENDLLDEEDDDDDDEIVTLYDKKSGKKVDFDVLAVLDYKDKWYTVLAPCESTEDMHDDECLVFELIEKEDGSDDYLPVTQSVMDAVYAEFERMCDEEKRKG